MTGVFIHGEFVHHCVVHHNRQTIDETVLCDFPGFVDAGRGDPLQVIWGGGGGLRLAWNKNFIIRLDVAASPFEANAPGLYINLNHIF